MTTQSIKMNPEWKAKWLEALRSGKYVQGTDCLRNSEDQYCCLGVLCDVYDTSQWHPEISFGKHRKYCTTDDFDDMYIPFSLYKAFGVSSHNPKLPVSGDLQRRLENDHNIHTTDIGLARLNDLGFTFNEIADLIDQYL